MNRAQRIRIATRMAAIAEKAGAVVMVEDSGQDRSTRVECTFPDVHVAFDIDTLHNGGILASWYGAERDLAPGLWADSVNPHHFRKATLYRPDPDTFADAFERACTAVLDGSAFKQEQTA